MADPIDFGAVAGLLLGGLSLFLYGMEKMSDGAPQLPAHMRTRALTTFTRALSPHCVGAVVVHRAPTRPAARR